MKDKFTYKSENTAKVTCMYFYTDYVALLKEASFLISA